jgi:hypothetical protein
MSCSINMRATKRRVSQPRANYSNAKTIRLCDQHKPKVSVKSGTPKPV